MGTYPSLHWRLQTINKPEHGFSRVNIGALSTLLRKLHDILSNHLTLATFSQGLMHFVHVIGLFKVTKQCSLQRSPTGCISLDRIPSKCRSIQQSYSNLPLLNVILQVYKLEVSIKLMAEPGDQGSVHFPAKLEGSYGFTAAGKAGAVLAYWCKASLTAFS